MGRKVLWVTESNITLEHQRGREDIWNASFQELHGAEMPDRMTLVF